MKKRTTEQREKHRKAARTHQSARKISGPRSQIWDSHALPGPLPRNDLLVRKQFPVNAECPPQVTGQTLWTIVNHVGRNVLLSAFNIGSHVLMNPCHSCQCWARAMLSKLHNTFVTLMLHADKDTAHVSRDRERVFLLMEAWSKLALFKQRG